ncbi:MAG: sulfurtransferase TusA family protein [Deltaproteobacteria bacterium]|nr:sulfurtransferase TusA family protein [Deltaproteobacteria bacterium]
MTPQEVDARGEICPYPEVMAQKAMKALRAGDRLVVKIDYAMSTETIPRWAEGEGHTVVEIRKTGHSEWEIILQKAG